MHSTLVTESSNWWRGNAPCGVERIVMRLWVAGVSQSGRNSDKWLWWRGHGIRNGEEKLRFETGEERNGDGGRGRGKWRRGQGTPGLTFIGGRRRAQGGGCTRGGFDVKAAKHGHGVGSVTGSRAWAHDLTGPAWAGGKPGAAPNPVGGVGVAWHGRGAACPWRKRHWR